MDRSIFAQIADQFTDESRLQSWLDVESALARSQARLKIIPDRAARDIAEKCYLEELQVDRYQEMYRETKHPLVPLLQLLREAVGANGEYVHLGATTHDIVDIAKMRSLKFVWEAVESILIVIEKKVLDLAEKYARTVMPGRSHNVQALPITFGFKAAIWASEIRRNIERLRSGRHLFVVTFSGANGTMASFGGKGHELEALMAAEFGFGVPDITWHAARDRIAEIASVFAIIGGTLARIAQEVYLLMGTETRELLEGYREGIVGSSAMPHKINPINAQHIMGAARTLRYDAAHCLECMLIDHEHNLVHFDDERTTVERIGRTMADLMERSYELIDTLYVDEKRMRQNVYLLDGLILSENVMLALGEKIGKMSAKDVITEISLIAIKESKSFSDLLKTDHRVNRFFSTDEIDRLLSPDTYADSAAAIALAYVAQARSLSEEKEDG